MSGTNDMYFDTNEFDFTSLTDIVGLEAEDNERDMDTHGGVVDDMSDILGTQENEAEEEVEEEEPEEEESEEGEIEVTDEDGEEVDFEDYQITLPTGDEVTLSELVKGYKSNDELNTAINEFQEAQTEFVEKSKDIGRLLELAKLEADRTIEDYNGFDWGRYKSEDPAGYVENREYLDRFIERRKEITAAMEAREASIAAEEAQRKAAEAAEAGAVLARDIPGWNKSLYESLMEYAIQNGADKEYIMNATDPVMFKMIYKAMQFEKGKQTVTAKVKRLGGSPSKVVKPGAKPAPTEADVNKKKAVISKMGGSRKDNIDAFAFLKD